MISKEESVSERQGSEGLLPEVGTLGAILVLLRWKRFIIWFVIVATGLSVVVSLLLPKWYRSTTSLLPPKNQALTGVMGNLTSLLKDFAPVSSGKLLGQSPAYNYLAILKSRKLEETAIRQFGLVQVYGIDDTSMEKALKEFEDNYLVEVSDEGSIKVSVYDKDPLRAANIANYAARTLNDVSIELGAGEAKNSRIFLEKRVTENQIALRSAEESLKTFQESHGIIFLSDEARSSLQSISQLYVRKVQLEIDLSILGKTTGDANPEYERVRLELNEVGKKLSTFPRLGMESYRLYQELLIQQKIMEFLLPLYEQARFEEQKDIPVMVVLDSAVPAEKRARPQRTLIVLASSLSSLMIAVLIAFMVSRLREFKTVNSQQYRELLAAARRVNNS